MSEQTEKHTVLGLRIPESLLEKLKALAAEDDRTVSSAARKILKDALEKEDAQ